MSDTPESTTPEESNTTSTDSEAVTVDTSASETETPDETEGTTQQPPAPKQPEEKGIIETIIAATSSLPTSEDLSNSGFDWADFVADSAGSALLWADGLVSSMTGDGAKARLVQDVFSPDYNEKLIEAWNEANPQRYVYRKQEGQIFDQHERKFLTDEDVKNLDLSMADVSSASREEFNQAADQQATGETPEQTADQTASIDEPDTSPIGFVGPGTPGSGKGAA